MWRRTAAVVALRTSSSHASAARATAAQREILCVHARRLLRTTHAHAFLRQLRCMTTTRTTASGSSVEKPATTPMVQQYLERKKEYPGACIMRIDDSIRTSFRALMYVVVAFADCMLLFQVGDFYEFFGDDARRASHVRRPSYSCLSASSTGLRTVLCVMTDYCCSCSCTVAISCSTWH